MKKLIVLVLVFVLVLDASADPVTVRVTEIAGGVAYVTPGRAAGLVPGTAVHIRGRDLVVVEATEQTAVLRSEGAIAIGDTGSANVDRASAQAIRQLPRPHPASAFDGQWPEAVKPAETQNPQPVALGTGKAPGAAHVTVIGHGYGALSQHGVDGDGEGRVIASFDLMSDRPLAADLDVAGRMFANGWDKGTHTPLFVRAAELRYGNAYDPQYAIGRLRYAASSVGMLDGGRVAARTGTLELAAFGGLVPDPVSGKPSTDASRFGAELVWNDSTATWQPRVAMVAQGSTWTGKLDERRLSVVASAGHQYTWLDGWAEAQQFPSDNPWGAKSIELTGAGGTFEWREHGTHLGADVTYFKPERSLRLAALLPPQWLCTLAPQPGNVPEKCASGDYYTAASGSAGVQGSHWTIDAVGTIGETHGYYRGYDSSGYLRGELRLSSTRLILGASGGHASFAAWAAGEVGIGTALSRRMDAIVTYRPELLDYTAGTGAVTLHSIVFDGHYALSPAFDVAGSALATTGSDRDAIAVLATFVWRPLP